MNKKTSIIIANAIIWAAVIVASAIVLGGTEYFGQMLPILGGGVAISMIILGSSNQF